MRVFAAWILALSLVVLPSWAGTAAAGNGKDGSGNDKNSATAKTIADGAANKTDSAAKPAPAGLENEIQQLRDLIEAQARQLQLQNEELKEQQRKMEALQTQLAAVGSGGSLGLVNEAAEPTIASSPVAASGAIRSVGQDKKDESPLAIRFKGITITPGGFFAAETVWRQHAISNDVNTDFKAIPLAGQSTNQLSEFNFSGRQSRISMKAEGKLANVKLTGYYEGDFLSAGVTSNNNESNSYTFRQRQFWGQAAFESGWKVTGGQQWSLVTETKHSLDNLTEATPLTIDAQYTVGFSWARQYGLRVTKNFGDKLWLGLSIEGPQTTFGGKIQNDTTLIAAPGDLGGLFNNQANYSFNASPDFIVKGAWEPGFGHYELFGIISTFKARTFPCANANSLNPCVVDGSTSPSAIGASNDTVVGGGIGANARWSLFSKKLDIGIHALGGDGVGRYGTTTLADVTAHANGTLEPLRAYQALGTLELHPTPKLDIYLYAGGEYAGKAAYTVDRVTSAGPPPVITTLGVGYGSPLLSNAGCLIENVPGNQNTPGSLGSCQQDIRNIIEGTAGFWYRFYQGDKGRFQFGMQYSYAVRNTWAAIGPVVSTGAAVTPLGTTTTPPLVNPAGLDSMFFTSVRYYLP